MRLHKYLLVTLIIAGLATGLVWCVGSCCAATGRLLSTTSIGALSCCGAGTPSGCQPSIQRADAATISLIAVAHSPIVLATGPVTPDAIVAPAGSRAVRPGMPVLRRGSSLLHTPLLI